MKKLLLVPALCFGGFAMAQTLKPAKLTKVAQVVKTSTGKTTMKMEMMGQEMDIPMDTESETKLMVTYEGAGGKIEQKPQRMKITMSMMGQEMVMDSENPDASGPGAEAMAGLKDKITVYMFDANGNITGIDASRAEDGSASPAQMSDVMNMAGLSKGSFVEFMLPLRKEVKPGEMWIDSSISEGVRVVNTYTYNGTSNDETTVDVKSVLSINRKTAQQGQNVEFNLSGTLNQQLTVNPANMFILTRKTVGDMKGVMNMMDNNAPVTVTMNTQDSYKY